MVIERIEIENFKSIKKLDFELNKIGKSYTQMLVGINESGKSNILNAMSLFNITDRKYDYNIWHNQKDEENNNIEIRYMLNFENRKKYTDGLSHHFDSKTIPRFTICDIVKTIYLESDSNIFKESYSYSVVDFGQFKYIKRIKKKVNVNNQEKIKIFTEMSRTGDDTFQELNENSFKKIFDADILKIIKQSEPSVSMWSPSPEYLISDIDLNTFKTNVNSNIPLKHIFVLAGYKTDDEIKDEVDKISNQQLRRKLMSKLSEAATKYIKNIWKHKIEFDLEITETGKCGVSIKDEGKNNQYNFHKMSVRSEGFKQFISLILSISIESRKLNKKNNLILIDEPEAHLHPSGIRDLREELIQIGQNNYLFVSTHSPFLVDRIHKERNIIIKKNGNALTEKKILEKEDDIRDDEVLDLAFGINIYKDLLIPKRILVEGATDKVLLLKAFKAKDLNYGITNGSGSNIVQIASKLNSDDISILVISDDDEDGQKYKKDILKISGVYNETNVFTLRDLVGDIKNDSTIEDLLPKEYIKSHYSKLYKDEWNEDPNIDFDDTPFIPQIKIDLQKKGRFTKEFLDRYKTSISDNFNPSKGTFSEKYEYLDKLVIKINEVLN